MSEQPSLFKPAGRRESDRQAYKPILITIVCAALLAAGSCYGAITSSLNSALLFGIVFFISAGTLVGAIIWLIVAAILNRSRRG
jgi:hypothetical protein